MDEEFESTKSGGQKPSESGGSGSENESGWAEENGLDTPASKKEVRLGELILKLMDGELERRHFLRMQKWLMCDEQALHYYIEFVQLCAAMRMLYSRDKEPMIPCKMSV